MTSAVFDHGAWIGASSVLIGTGGTMSESPG